MLWPMKRISRAPSTLEIFREPIRLSLEKYYKKANSKIPSTALQWEKILQIATRLNIYSKTSETHLVSKIVLKCYSLVQFQAFQEVHPSLWAS